MGENGASAKQAAIAATAVAEAEEVKRYEAFSRDQDPETYALLDELIERYHASDLAEAHVGLCWWYDVKPDRDGKLSLGKAIKVSERERQYHDFDFIVLLNWEVWQKLLPAPRRAVLDHELTHLGRVENEDGSSRYYIRKHDLEEFNAIVRRYGLWRQEVYLIVAAAVEKHGERGLFDRLEEGVSAE